MSNNSLFKKCNSWTDFQSQLKFFSKKEKGNAFELLTKFYFKINPIYSFYDDVWLFDEVPSKELEYLGLPSQDLGIDLIAKQGNEYHAIQCKYHSDKTSSVTFKEVSTFISLLESNDKISQGYICSSADLTSRNFNKLKTKPINLIMSDSWQLLDEKFFSDVRKIIEGKRVKLAPFQPRPHQKKALIDSKNYFIKEDHSRGKLIFPCGAGKSLTGFWMTQELKSKSTIIAVPSLSLVKQTLEVYLREIVAKNKRVKWLCICSDEGIGKNDDIAIFTENLGVPCQTDPDYIEQWLRDNIDEEKIIFTTYQSGRIIAEISKKLNFKFDVGIFDEAHKTVGSNKKLFSHLLFEENISIEKRIFMTATERFYSGSKDDIISMDDEDVYGDTFTKMSFKEAIEAGLLTDYKVITIDIKKSEIADFIRENNLVQLNDKWKKETEARSLASMLALRKAMKRFSIKNAVSFHSSIEKAVRNKELQKHITETYNFDPIDTFTVSGKQSTTKRNDIVQEFASSENALITNARCLTEGVDVPNIDCIVFADPRKSKVDIVQALGRALRKKDGKDWGYVILPVIYDEQSGTIDNDSFNEILTIVRGLASNDERIVEYFKDKNTSSKEAKEKKSEQFNFEVFSDYIDESILSEQIQIRLWDKLAKLNWMSFDEAKTYIKQFSFKSQNEYWEAHRKGILRKDLPYAVHSVYENDGFESYPDFLGYESLFREVLPFEEARKYARSLGLKNSTEWREFVKSDDFPSNIPKRPRNAYKDSGWISFGDWLGTGRRKGGYREFSEAKKVALSLKLTTTTEWIDAFENGLIPDDIPKYPNQVYKGKGWINWGDFLGTGKVASHLKVYRKFKEAREFVRGLGLKNTEEWRNYCRSGELPDDIPKSPHITYKNKGWSGMYDWLGRKEGRRYVKERDILPYEEAKQYALSLKLKNWNEWRLYAKSGKLPIKVPKDPSSAYKNTGWVNWGEWLGTGSVSTQQLDFLSYEESKKEIKKYKLKSSTQWRDLCKAGKRPENIPANPNTVYSSEWVSWGEWLGTGKIANKDKNFLTFEEAKKFALTLGLRNEKDWRAWKRENKLPDNIPAKPNVVYKGKGWKGFVDFLRDE